MTTITIWQLVLLSATVLVFIPMLILNKKRYLKYQWEVVLKDMDSNEELIKHFTNMEIFRDLRQLHKQGLGKLNRMASTVHDSLRDTMMSSEAKAIIENPIHTKQHSVSEFRPGPNGTAPRIVKEFVQMVADSANMAVVSINPVAES